MLIGSPQSLNSFETNDFTLHLNGAEIKRKTSTKCLGIYVDENLTWKTHIEHIVTKISAGLFVLRKLKTVLPQD